jgi:hypothetical protein
MGMRKTQKTRDGSKGRVREVGGGSGTLAMLIDASDTVVVAVGKELLQFLHVTAPRQEQHGGGGGRRHLPRLRPLGWLQKQTGHLLSFSFSFLSSALLPHT